MKLITRVVSSSVLMIGTTFAHADVPVIDKSDSYIETPHSQQAYVEAQENESSRATLLETVSRMQKEIQDLRGQLEVQSHDLKMLQQQQDAYYKDLDSRVGSQSANSAAQTATSAPGANTAAEPETKTIPLPAPQSTSSNPAGEKEAFVEASGYVNAKKYSLAQESLQSYLQKYPDSANAPEAHYWLGELLLIGGDSQAAVREFETITKKFPQSNKSAQALLKLGFVYFDQGELVKSKAALEEVKTRFPNSTSATLAANRLQAIEDVMK